MLKILDRYIIRNFLGTFFLTLVLILLIAIVFDISEKIEDFLVKGASFKEIVFDYYLNFVLFYGNMFSSMIVFISTIFFTSRLTGRSEIVAMLTGGQSFRRLMWPYFLSSLIIASISYILAHYVIPKSNVSRIIFEDSYVYTRAANRFNDVHRQINPGHFVYMENFNGDRFSGYRFTYEVFDGNELTKKLSSDFINYDTATSSWRLDNYTLRIINPEGDILTKGARLDTALPFSPDVLSPEMLNSAMMNTPRLKEFINAEILRGSESINAYKIELYRRTSFPVATFILVLIAVSLSSKKNRGGLGLNVAMGFGICVSYIFFMQISTVFSTNGNLSPWSAVWLPNFIFLIVGLILYRIAPK
jgi:lipopolysaccharide export system permease protein